MIFKTFNSDSDKVLSKIGILGKSFEQIGTSIRQRKFEIDNLMGAMSKKDAKTEVGGFWSYIFGNKSIKENPIDLSKFIELDELKASNLLKSLQEIELASKTNTSVWQEYFSTLNDGQKWQIEFVKNNDLQKASTEDLVKANQQARASALAHNEAIKAQTLSAKAGSVALKALSIAANMIAFTLITKGIQFIVSSIKDWIHSIDIAKEELEEANSKLEETNSELETTASRIDELNAKENLSLVEAEELDKLKEANKELERELRIREDIAKVKGAKANKEALLYFDSKSGSLSESFFAQFKEDITNFDFFGKSSLYSGMSPVFTDKVSEAEYYIEQAEKLKQKLAEITDKESKEYESISASIKEIEVNLSKTISDFMEKDDLLIKGEDNGLLERLDALYEKYDVYTNGRAYVVENKLSSILAKVDFKDDTKELEELGKSGELSLDILTSKFPDLIAYLNDAGISAQELYQYIMALSNPDAINYGNVKKQLLYSIGGRQSLREILSLDEEELVLNAYLKVRAQYGEHPEGWTAEDWLYNIQQELNDRPVEVEVSTPTLSISDTISQLNTKLKPAFDSLKSAYNDIFTDDGFALDAEDIPMLDSIKFCADTRNWIVANPIPYLCAKLHIQKKQKGCD